MTRSPFDFLQTGGLTIQNPLSNFLLIDRQRGNGGVIPSGNHPAACPRITDATTPINPVTGKTAELRGNRLTAQSRGGFSVAKTLSKKRSPCGKHQRA